MNLKIKVVHNPKNGFIYPLNKMDLELFKKLSSFYFICTATTVFFFFPLGKPRLKAKPRTRNIEKHTVLVYHTDNTVHGEPKSENNVNKNIYHMTPTAGGGSEKKKWK